MRYIINDDDIEDWVARLKKVQEEISGGENFAHEQLEYIISQMENEMSTVENGMNNYQTRKQNGHNI